MSPLKYERLISKMSLEQKLGLITSTEFFKSSPVGGYEFPTFNIAKDPYEECTDGVHVTHFPCDNALAASWNSELIADVYAAIGAEARVQNPFAYYNCTNELKKEGVTDDYFLLGKFLASKVEGLRRGNAFVNFEDAVPVTAKQALSMRGVRDEVLATASPTSMIFNDVTEMDSCTHRFKYKDLVFGVVSTVEEALDYLYNGATFLFLQGDIFKALVNKLNTLTSAYQVAHTKFVNDNMAESSFARLMRTFRIFDGEIIDRACDRVIDIIYTMQASKEAPATFKSLKKGENSTFDEINHSELAYKAARQSAVLIKNESGILPLKRSLRLAVIGEYAKDISYQRKYYNSRATQEKLPFDEINDFELNTVGYGLGYAKGELGRTDLLDHAVSLASQSDVVLLYLSFERGSDQLPLEQTELLNAISGKGAKIVAIVSSVGNPDMSFASKCAAVLLTYVPGQGGALAGLEMVVGDVTPSGKLAKAIGRRGPMGYVVQYPVGFGLSYTAFTYENMKVNESGVSFTVRNVGNYDGYAVPMMYVKKNNTKSSFAQKTLRGFTKVFVAKGDAVRVKIPFTEQTFSLYTEDKGYYVESGMYTVTIGENDKEELLSGALLLKDYSEKNSFKSRVVETSTDGHPVNFSETNLPPEVASARKKLPFALKMTLALLLAVYVDAILILFGVGNIISQKGIVFYIIIGVVGVVVNALVIAYIIVVARKRHAEKYIHPNVVLTEMLENVEEFAEVAKVKYKKPVVEEKKLDLVREEEDEDDEEEEDEDDEEEETQYSATYEVSFQESDASDSVITKKITFGELNKNLKDYLLSKGINIDNVSSRALVSAIAASKLVFLTCKNAEMFPRFVKALSEYYANDTLIAASDEWKSLSDLLWCEGTIEGKFVLSAFSNAVYGAYKSKEQERVIVIDNVNLANLGSYFSHFLDYCNHPTEEYVISFNDNTSFRLPDNLTYVLAVQGGVLDGMPAEILNAASIVELGLTPAQAISQEEVKPVAMSHEDCVNTLNEVKEKSFVTEKIWKKVDALAESLAASEKFDIGNKNIIQMESFTSVMMNCGADEAEAVVGMFLSKLGFILKNTRAYRQDGGEKTVFALIERLFTEIELTKIKRLLTKPARANTAPAQPASQPAAPTAEGTAAQPAEAQEAPAQGQNEAQPAQPASQPEAQTAVEAQAPADGAQGGDGTEGK